MKTAYLPFMISPIKTGDKYLVSNRFGGWAVLSDEQVKRLNALNVDDDLMEVLKNRGIVVTRDNVDSIANRFVLLNNHLFNDVGLHIAVLTTKCNFDCQYCQARDSGDGMFMDKDVAAHVLKFVFASRRQNVTLELQGGEPFLNWETFKFIVSKAREWNNNTKNLQITVVTNGSLIDKEKIQFLKKYGVFVCVSYDGPASVHDYNRKYIDGRGSYGDVINTLGQLRLRMVPFTLITTVTSRSLECWKEIVDEYVDMGVYTIAFRPLSRINVDCNVWQSVGYTLDEFMDVYERVIRYILELNKKGIYIKERMMFNVVQKLLGDIDPSYVDMTSPCGAGRNVLSYMPDGSVYPCDETRMLPDREMFLLGNVLENEYDEVISSDVVLNMAVASSLDIVAPNDPYIAWTGTCPVYTYVESGSLVGKCSMLDFHNRVIKLFFELYNEFGQEFAAWIGKKKDS